MLFSYYHISHYCILQNTINVSNYSSPTFTETNYPIDKDVEFSLSVIETGFSKTPEVLVYRGGKLYRDNGSIKVTTSKEECEGAAKPNVDEEYQNYCVECLHGVPGIMKVDD